MFDRLRPSPTAHGRARYLASPAWDAHVVDGLEAMLGGAPRGPNDPRPIAAFDFDRTLVYGDVSEHLVALLDAREGTDRLHAYEQACAEDLRRGYVELVSTLVAGRTEPEVRSMALDALDDGRRKGLLAEREPMRELVWALHRHGWDVWVVTASAEPLVQPIAERFGVAPDRVLGMRSALGDDGRYLPVVLEPYTMQAGKIAALRAATGRDPAFAAGDSRSDAPMLEAAQRALLLDHGDQELARDAAARGWWVQPGGQIR